MKKMYLTFFILLTTLIFADISVISGFLNDNYTGSTENGVNGNYIGADDFLTFSLFVNSKRDRLGISQYYQVATSRKYNYRYDLLSTDLSYELLYNNFTFIPSVSFIYKGQVGGETIQNGIHEFRNIPYLEQNYSDSEISPSINSDIIYKYRFFRGWYTLEIPYSIKPVNTSLNIDYTFDNRFFVLNVVAGYKQYITEVKEYSDFVRSGATFGGQVIVPIYKDFSINAGTFFFPTQNLDHDPLYSHKDFEYSPQFWVTFGLNGKNFGVLDVVKY